VFLLAGVAAAATATAPVRLAGPSSQFQTGMVDYEGSAAVGGSMFLQRTKAAGASIVRIGLQWAQVAPAARAATFDPRDPADPAYDWSAVDAALEATAASGLTPLLAFNTAPSWARADPGEPASAPRPSAAADFLTAAARRYSGSFQGLPRVRNWQIWVEPNVNVYFAPQFAHGQPASPTLYRDILAAAGTALHAVSAANVVVGGGLSPFTVVRGPTVTIGPLRFIRNMLCMSAGAHPRPTCRTRVAVDAWAIHPYSSGDAQHHASNPDDVSVGDLPKLRALLAAAAAAGHLVSPHPIQLWVTEFSWDTKPPDPNAVPLALATRWISEGFYRMWQAGVRVCIWLQLRDSPFPSGPVQAGLYFRGATPARDRPKPTLAAFRFPFVAYRQGARATVWGRVPDSRAEVVRIEVRSGGWVRVATLRSGSGGVFRGTIGIPHSATSLRAHAGPRTSVPFSLHRPPDHPVDPFGT
jgi:hypothetical protein